MTDNTKRQVRKHLAIMVRNHGDWIKRYAEQARREGRHWNTYAVCECSMCRLQPIYERQS